MTGHVRISRSNTMHIAKKGTLLMKTAIAVTRDRFRALPAYTEELMIRHSKRFSLFVFGALAANNKRAFGARMAGRGYSYTVRS